MKQSNIILGIGIIVAVILIAGSLFLKAEPLDVEKSVSQIQPKSVFNHSAKKIVMKKFDAFTRYIIKIQ